MVEQIRPNAAEELKEVVAWAAAEETPLEILGAGTKRAYGRPVEAATQVALDGLAGISLCKPEELVISAGPRTPLAEIEALLSSRTSWTLAFEPPDYGALLGGEAGRARWAACSPAIGRATAVKAGARVTICSTSRR